MKATHHISDRSSLHGVGVGLRSDHFQTILETRPDIPWFEVLSDNFLIEGGPALQALLQICEHYPVAMHSVGMSLGSTDPLNADYLQKLKTLMDRIEPALVSDHLCWISHQGHHLHELLPLPYTEDAVKHVAERIQYVQEYLGRQILIENVSSYLSFQQSEMSEWAFLSAISEAADCLILLDINNIYVSSHNHHFNALDYLTGIPKKRVAQYHLAGFQDCGHYLLDNHGGQVDNNVWQLYQMALEVIGNVPTLLEWDNNIPSFAMLCQEAEKAQSMMDAIE